MAQTEKQFTAHYSNFREKYWDSGKTLMTTGIKATHDDAQIPNWYLTLNCVINNVDANNKFIRDTEDSKKFDSIEFPMNANDLTSLIEQFDDVIENDGIAVCNHLNRKDNSGRLLVFSKEEGSYYITIYEIKEGETLREYKHKLDRPGQIYTLDEDGQVVGQDCNMDLLQFIHTVKSAPAVIGVGKGIYDIHNDAPRGNAVTGGTAKIGIGKRSASVASSDEEETTTKPKTIKGKSPKISSSKLKAMLDDDED